MDLFLVRHAEAVDLGHEGVSSDAERFLSPEGHEQAFRLGAWLKHSGVPIAAVVTSPMVRARQTAEGMIARLTPPAPPIHVFDEIAESMRPKRVSRFLAEFGDTSVVLVGHQPTLGQFLGWLIGSRDVAIRVGKGAMARLNVLDWRKGGAELVWLVTQDWLESEAL
jgi:phosphohistidine phosphatase